MKQAPLAANIGLPACGAKPALLPKVRFGRVTAEHHRTLQAASDLLDRLVSGARAESKIWVGDTIANGFTSRWDYRTRA